MPPGQIEVTLSYHRHVGGRYIHGSLTLQFDGTRKYSFTSLATWPSTESYETAIKGAVDRALFERLGSLEHVAIVLTRVELDPVASSEAGFSEAARAATLAAFELNT